MPNARAKGGADTTREHHTKNVTVADSVVQGTPKSPKGKLGMADGSSIGVRILIKAGKPVADEFAVLVHELAHEMLHRIPKEQRPSKTVRETESKHDLSVKYAEVTAHRRKGKDLLYKPERCIAQQSRMDPAVKDL